jgi:hypothetical protein
LLDKAKKSLYGLYRKIQNISIPIDLQLKLFDSLVTPILLYSAEVFGFWKQGLYWKNVFIVLQKNSKSSKQHSKFYGVWGIREAAFGNNGKTKTGIILEQHVIQ